MKTWTATRTESDGEYGETFVAADWAQAARICDERGWRLDGTLMMTIPASEMTMQQADELIARRNAGVRCDA